MKKIIILLSVFIITEAYSQVGINTSNPINKFHVDGNKDNPLSGNPNNTQQANDFSVTSAGQVGVGTISPKLNLDTIITIRYKKYLKFRKKRVKIAI